MTMAAQVTIDIRSFIIGTIVGIVILAAIGLWRWDWHETPKIGVAIAASDQMDASTAAVPDPGTLDYTAQFEQQQKVEEVLRNKVQGMLDQVIGKNRSTVQISVDMDFSRRTTEMHSVVPGEAQVVLNEKTSEKQSAEHGSEENLARNYEVNRVVESTRGPIGTVNRISLAITMDKTKVFHDVETNTFIEKDRDKKEIEQLEDVAKRAIGFNEVRGDAVTIFAMRFDKSQEIQAKESARAADRREFWTGVAINFAKIGAILLALVVLQRIWRRSESAGFASFLRNRDSQAALLIAAGVFLCSHALHLWGESLSWGELGALPGLFFLLLGASRVCRHCSSSEVLQTP